MPEKFYLPVVNNPNINRRHLRSPVVICSTTLDTDHLTAILLYIARCTLTDFLGSLLSRNKLQFSILKNKFCPVRVSNRARFGKPIRSCKNKLALRNQRETCFNTFLANPLDSLVLPLIPDRLKTGRTTEIKVLST
ncbi:hypothetical protein J6590_077489 [Homalodisca vitripennis]|nr:hypothetical protein J6590_077489 [Homalodisca vitripennis]